MLATLVIVFREVLEAGLIVGIVLAVTRGLPGSLGWVMKGIAGGIAGAVLVALFAETISSSLAGMGQELLNAGILALAVLMLAWHNIWMATHAREMTTELRHVSREIVEGRKPLAALAIVVGVAVLREGSEVVLFLFGIMASGGATQGGMIAGGALGLALGVAVGLLTYRGLVALPMRQLFSVTGWLITLLAAGLAAQCVFFLEQAGVIAILGDTIWDSSAILSQKSLPGTVLHALIGYIDRPSQAQALAYAGVVAIITLATRWARRSAQRAVTPAGAVASATR